MLAVMGAGAAGFCVGGPVGAAAAGIGAGATMDGIYTVATDQPHGYLAAVSNIVDNPSAGVYLFIEFTIYVVPRLHSLSSL